MTDSAENHLKQFQEAPRSSENTKDTQQLPEIFRQGEGGCTRDNVTHHHVTMQVSVRLFAKISEGKGVQTYIMITVAGLTGI